MPTYTNKFRGATFHEETIVDRKEAIIGYIRVKPSSVLWKPKGKQTFYSVKLDDFVKWITAPATGAKLTKS